MKSINETTEVVLRPFGMLFAVDANEDNLRIDEDGELFLDTLECGTSQTCNEK